MKETILILGGGPAGMACAMELHNAKKTSLIIEANDKIGGLAKTLEFREGKYLFRTDIGPHRFFSKNKYLYRFVEDLLHEKWILVPRQTRQFIDGKFYDYPIKPMQAFRNIGPINASAMMMSYGHGVIKHRLLKKEMNNFEDYVVANFGKKLGDFNILNYTEKIWGIPCNEIHPDWAKQRIKGLNITSVLKSMLSKKKKDSPKSLVDSFYYPQYGTGLIYDTIAKKITTSGSKIQTNSRPTKIIHSGNKVTQVELDNNGKNEIVKPKKVVTSIPITELINILQPAPPKKVIDAAKKLRWRDQVYLFITLNKKRITKDNWIYFPNKEIPFGRISEMKNFSKDMSPPDKTSIFVEFFVNEGDEIWNMTEDELFSITIKHFEKLGFFNRKDVRKYYLFKKKNVYPVYDINYPKNLKVIKDYLDTFENMIYIGRPGRFQYTNQDHSLEMGILAAKSILTGKKMDYDEIGSEQEYFEKGYIKDDKKKK